MLSEIPTSEVIIKSLSLSGAFLSKRIGAYFSLCPSVFDVGQFITVFTLVKSSHHYLTHKFL